jgi:hypothetical protein
MQHTLVDTGDAQYVTVYVKGQEPLSASDTHPNFQRIVDALDTEWYDVQPYFTNEAILELFDTAKSVARKLLSERVSVANGQVYFDHEPVDDSITDQIVRFLDEGIDNWRPLVAFMENIALNPNTQSRTQLYDWLRARAFTLTLDGEVVGYKGVTSDGKGGYCSQQSGTAIVDGVTVKGRIPNQVGSVVEMPRGDVQHDPSTGCSTGLHVGTFDYAADYGRGGAMLRVLVNPRDVVSVPLDGRGEKIRVCRYKVNAIINETDTQALYDERHECPDCSDSELDHYHADGDW